MLPCFCLPFEHHTDKTIAYMAKALDNVCLHIDIPAFQAFVKNYDACYAYYSKLLVGQVRGVWVALPLFAASAVLLRLRLLCGSTFNKPRRVRSLLPLLKPCTLIRALAVSPRVLRGPGG